MSVLIKNSLLTYSELAERQLSLYPFLITDKGGRKTIDFKNVDSLRALNRAILKEGYDLDIHYPSNSLVPTVPMRVEYIAWMHNIFKNTSEKLCGIDIGTGTTGIYALLGSRMHSWSMIGTEIEDESISYARANVERNGLTELVRIVKVEKSENMFDEAVKTSSGKTIDFTLCNPPFFSSEFESNSMVKSRNFDRPPPPNAKTGTIGELSTTGGELAFISKMIQDSKSHALSIGIFTTLVGVKKHIETLKKELKEIGAIGVCEREFCPGKNTRRWTLGWTFNPSYVNLVKTAPVATHSSATLSLPCSCPDDKFIDLIRSLFTSPLEFTFLKTEGEFEVIGEQSSWKGQRRKRRHPETLKAESEKKIGKLEDFSHRNYLVHLRVLCTGEGKLTFELLSGSDAKNSLCSLLQFFTNYFKNHECKL